MSRTATSSNEAVRFRSMENGGPCNSCTVVFRDARARHGYLTVGHVASGLLRGQVCNPSASVALRGRPRAPSRLEPQVAWVYLDCISLPEA